ncbi:MAG: prolyl oligopeptidase family serine peptidase [Planctomycetes bacterium]|nr:prolyl oligopeptidase family serine peptidase [Planctomycetota bacterium]
MQASVIALALALAVAADAPRAQGTAADYQRAAASAAKWRRATRAFAPEVHWTDDGAWFERGTGGEHRFVRVSRDGAVQVDADPAKLGIDATPQSLAPLRRVQPSRNSSREAQIVFDNRFDRPVRLFWVDTDGQPQPYGEIAAGARRDMSTYVGHVFLGDFEKDDVVGVFVAGRGKGVAVFDEASQRALRESEPARREPRSERVGRRGARLSIREHDVWLRDGGEEVRLTDDGTAADAYREPRHASPDGRFALGFRVAEGEPHPVYMVDSSPRDQLQPKLFQHDYTKPGDRIDAPRPVLFDLVGKRRVSVDEAPFVDAWSIDHVRWSEHGREVYCLYNRRGHQLLRLYAIDAATGAVRVVLEEKSDTFVDYSQKTTLHWLAGGGSFLWASERDGWNHLYVVDAATGAMRQLTKGEWVVRALEKVDEAAGEVWFTAMGIRPGQDPYHKHLARIRLDGSALTVLTEGDGSHEWQFSPDGSLFVDRWSRADHPWVTELRRAQDGALVAELGRDDVEQLLATGYRPPERFVAKGRDGVTDIHGILIVPSDFDPAKRYPVVEDIYAGPHDHFVPKRWELGNRQRALAELGFVVVKIDGMGTNWRSRAFHDVCWRNLKDAGFPDRIAWLRAAAAERPWLDLERVGIFGGSAGGQSALAALLHHGDFYKVAVADCGCHDNRMDKIWWNEAWMGYPIGPWYADSSNVTHAAKLTGKLLLTVGELDRNVDPASTMQVVDALIRADKDFDFVIVPGGGHGVGEMPYLVRRRQDFFVRWLHGVEPRR